MLLKIRFTRNYFYEKIQRELEIAKNGNLQI